MIQIRDFGELKVSNCCHSVAKSCLTAWELHHLPEFAQTHVHWVGDSIQPFHPLSPPSAPGLNPSQHWGKRLESFLVSWLCIRWPKNWSFSFSISPSNEYSGLISFRIDWFDLLAGQGALKGLLQQSLIRHPHCLNPYLTDVRKHKQPKPKAIVIEIQIEHEHLTSRNCIHFSLLKGLEFNWVRHAKELQNHLGEFMSKS